MSEPRATTSRLPSDEGREHLMVQVARMNYLQNKTLTEIAAETGLNRWQVSRLLQEARELGIVHIEVVPRTLRHPDLEARLLRSLGLRDAVVVPGPTEQGLEAVAQAASQYLAAIRTSTALLGVSWGRSMAAVARWLPEAWTEAVHVVQINGTVAPTPGIAYHNTVAEVFARKGQGRMTPLPVPAIVGARLTREVLEQDRIVADVLTLARSAPTLVFSMGVAGEDSVLMRSGNVTEAEMTELIAGGAVGDVLGRFIDRSGNIVDAELDARTVGLTFDDLHRAERAIAVVCGGNKHAIALGALRAGLFNVLVTDEETATFLLEHAYDR